MTLSKELSNLLSQALTKAWNDKILPLCETEPPVIERPQKIQNGDYACSLPMKLASIVKISPMEIAKILTSRIPPKNWLGRVWPAPPGFINFELDPLWLALQVDEIRACENTFGETNIGRNTLLQVEFVSVNPTGPLHVGHARGAVIGSALSNVLEVAGYRVKREYYVNDAGNQMELFNQSLYARYCQTFGQEINLPEDGYQGEYLIELAERIKSDVGDRFTKIPEQTAVIELGELGLRHMLEEIKVDMEGLRVSYDMWFSERSLYSGGQYHKAMTQLKNSGHTIVRDGATWFRSSILGDEKDKVLVRTNGDPTYFATDVAYHFEKFFERKFDRVVDIFGADHQGHIRFMRAVANAMGIDQKRLDLLIYQLVTLKRGGETVRVSKRTGDLITVKELVEEVGVDACRFFFLSRSPESQMDFDLELAKEESDKNPVYYVQYAHARISGILRLSEERSIIYEDGNLDLLTNQFELDLIRKILIFPELIETMALNLAPHHLPHYSVELATSFHAFYGKCRVVSNDPMELDITKARLKLVEATKIALKRCLSIMSMDAPENM